VLFRAAGLVIEFDVFAAHGGREAFVADRRRQNQLTMAGYRVLRVTWDDLVQRPEEIVAEIRALTR
jgi:very-short-patch-repair endonuclease